MDPEQEIAALAEHPGRAAGTDAERRTARHLQSRLHALGREAELQPIEIWPRAGLAHALHAVLAVAGSLASVRNAALGAALVLAAAVLTSLDVTGVLRLTRRMTGRRASQNVISREGGESAGVVLVVAHYDAARATAGLARLTRYVRDPWAVMLASIVLLLACCALRLIGALGMSEWLRRNRKELSKSRTVVVGLHGAGAGELRFGRRHGALVPLRAHPDLLRVCRTVVEDGAEAAEVVVHEPVDAAVATARGIPAVTVMVGGGARDREALERSFLFCRELIGRIDTELGPRLARS